MLLRRYRKTVPVVKNPAPVIAESDISIEEIEQTEETDAKLTRTDIARMNKAELIEQAESVGIDTTDKSGATLKELLIEHYGL